MLGLGVFCSTLGCCGCKGLKEPPGPTTVLKHLTEYTARNLRAVSVESRERGMCAPRVGNTLVTHRMLGPIVVSTLGGTLWWCG